MTPPRMWLATLIASVTFAAATMMPPHAANAQEEPDAAVDAFFDQVNTGAVAGALALVDESFIFTEIDQITGGSLAVVGKLAFADLLGSLVDRNIAAIVTENVAEGSTATGEVEFSDDKSEAAGVDRYVQLFTITVADGRLTRADFTFDESDPQTVQYVGYTDEQASEGENPAGLLQIPLAAQPGGNQPGNAYILDQGSLTFVGLLIAPGADGVLQPAHFHTGTCDAPGPIVYPLAPVLDGSSRALLSAPASDLLDQGLIINVHKSEAEMGVYVACGDIETPAAAPTATAPAAPAPTATAGTGVVAPDTGQGGGGPGARTGISGWIAGVAVLAFIVGGTVIGAGYLMRAGRDEGTPARRRQRQAQ